MKPVEQLTLLREKGGIISNLSREIKILSNGLPYYFVEFTSTMGSQYGIEAYGEDATELYSETMQIIGHENEVLVPLISH